MFYRREMSHTDTSIYCSSQMAVFKIIFGVKKHTSNKKLENKNIITLKQKYYNQNLILR